MERLFECTVINGPFIYNTVTEEITDIDPNNIITQRRIYANTALDAIDTMRRRNPRYERYYIHATVAK